MTTENSIHSLGYLGDLLRLVCRADRIRHDPAARGVCDECIAIVECKVAALKTKMQNELNEMELLR